MLDWKRSSVKVVVSKDDGEFLDLVMFCEELALGSGGHLDIIDARI